MEYIYTSIDYLKNKAQHPSVQKHTKNIGWMFFAKIASMVIAFLATAYIARSLGPQNYGELSYAISFVGLFSFLSSLGVEQILYRDTIQYPEKRNIYLGSAIGIRVIASLLTGLLCFGTAFFISPKDVSLFLIGLLSLTFVCGSFSLLSMEFQADAKSKYPSIFSVIVVIILNLSKILVIFNDKGVIYLAGVILLEPILYSCMYMYLRSKHYEPLRNLQFDTHIALKILKDSYPLIFASAFFMIYARIDQVMIKNMMSAEYVGLYDAAVRMSEISYFIPNIIVAALFPAIINAKKISEVIYFKRIKKLLITLLLVSTGIALITTLLATYFTLIIFGSKFLATVPILRIYVWSNIGTALNMLIQQVLISENLTKNVSLTIFFGMVTNVVLNVLLIPRLGMSGAALASLISYMIPFLSLYMFKKTRTLLINIANH
jgi:O-antigen/teichoic acid export membrane protein